MLPRLFLTLALTTLLACNQTQKNQASTNPVASAITIETTKVAAQTPEITVVKEVAKGKLITPGKGIGHLFIAQNTDSAMALLGKPDSSDAAMGSSLLVWYSGHDKNNYKTSIFAHRNMGGKDEIISRIKKIMITSPWFKTAEGISTGSAFTDIEKPYTLKQVADYTVDQKKIKVFDDIDKGISFDIDSSSNKCVAITVHAPNDSPGTYLNMH